MNSFINFSASGSDRSFNLESGIYFGRLNILNICEVCGVSWFRRFHAGLISMVFFVCFLTAEARVTFDFSILDMENNVLGKYTSNPLTVDEVTLTIRTSDDWFSGTGLHSPVQGPTHGPTVLAQDGHELTFTFNKAVSISRFLFFGFLSPEATDSATLTWGSSNSLVLSDFDGTDGSREFTLMGDNVITLAAGQALTFTSNNPSYTGGSIGDTADITEMELTVIPESQVYALGLGFVAMFGSIYVKRRRK